MVDKARLNTDVNERVSSLTGNSNDLFLNARLTEPKFASKSRKKKHMSKKNTKPLQTSRSLINLNEIGLQGEHLSDNDHQSKVETGVS